MLPNHGETQVKCSFAHLSNVFSYIQGLISFVGAYASTYYARQGFEQMPTRILRKVEMLPTGSYAHPLKKNFWCQTNPGQCLCISFHSERQSITSMISPMWKHRLAVAKVADSKLIALPGSATSACFSSLGDLRFRVTCFSPRRCRLALWAGAPGEGLRSAMIQSSNCCANVILLTQCAINTCHIYIYILLYIKRVRDLCGMSEVHITSFSLFHLLTLNLIQIQQFSSHTFAQVWQEVFHGGLSDLKKQLHCTAATERDFDKNAVFFLKSHSSNNRVLEKLGESSPEQI